MRDTFVEALLKLAKNDRNIELITGDLGFGVLKRFWEQLPDQFINAGIAEQNMTSLAAGMALEGKIVFTYSIGNFPTMRALEQIRNDCAYHNANVKIVCVGSGFTYGSLGMSHQATEDIAIMRALPNVTVFSPADAAEAEAITKAMVAHKGTCYLRLGRGSCTQIHTKLDNFTVGKAINVKSGSKVAILFTGAIGSEVIKAAKILEQSGISPTLYSFPTIKPLDSETILTCAEEHEIIVTCEEHNIIGGFGSSVAEVLAEHPTKAKLLRIGVPDTYCSTVGNQDYLRAHFDLDAQGIAEKILKYTK